MEGLSLNDKIRVFVENQFKVEYSIKSHSATNLPITIESYRECLFLCDTKINVNKDINKHVNKDINKHVNKDINKHVNKDI
ncbi:MAG: hypothetical protein E6341_07155, partial [Staphylococcus simulans]|nr:hypothetical protein [Staphylococcus simulans]